MTIDTSHGELWHLLFELAAYFVGFQTYLYLRQRSGTPALAGIDALWVIAGAIAGAALGSKVVYWLQYPDYLAAHPGDLAVWLGGKTIVGALLGGLAGVEAVKKLRGITVSTGDSFMAPLIVGMMIGRLGCFFAGIGDNTYGNPSDLPWAVTYAGDVPRHPVALYEIAFLALSLWTLLQVKPRLPQTGDMFRLFMVAYLTFRFAIDFIKPPHYSARTAAEVAIPPGYLYFGALTGIQLVCIAGLAYYLPSFLRMQREVKWQS